MAQAAREAAAKRIGQWARRGQQEFEGPSAPQERDPDEDTRDPDLKERTRLSFLDSYYRGTLLGASRLALLSHLASTPDEEGISPGMKRARDHLRKEYQQITAGLAWVEEQNARTLAKFGHAGFAADRDTLAAIYDRADNIPFVGRRGAHLYNFWKDAKNPRGLWRRTTLESFRSDKPQWEIVLDLDELAAKRTGGLDLGRRGDAAGDA